MIMAYKPDQFDLMLRDAKQGQSDQGKVCEKLISSIKEFSIARRLDQEFTSNGSAPMEISQIDNHRSNQSQQGDEFQEPLGGCGWDQEGWDQEGWDQEAGAIDALGKGKALSKGGGGMKCFTCGQVGPFLLKLSPRQGTIKRRQRLDQGKFLWTGR